jgi:hypothetical protein
MTFYTTIADMEPSGTFDLKRAVFRFNASDPSYEGDDSPQRHWIASLQGRVPLQHSWTGCRPAVRAALTN